MLINTTLANQYKDYDSPSLEYTVELLKNGVTTTIDHASVDTPIQYEQGLSGFPLGHIPLSILTVPIRGEFASEYYEDTDYQLRLIIDFEDTTITSQWFTVIKASHDIRTNKTVFNCEDKIRTLNTKWEAIEVTAPITLINYTKSLLNNLEIPYNLIELDNLFNGNWVLDEKPNLDDTNSMREYFQGLSNMSLSLIYLDFQGNMRFKRLSQLYTQTPYEIDSGIKDFKANRDRFKTLGINTLELALQSNIEGEMAIRSDIAMVNVDGSIPLRLNAIPFLKTHQEREEIIDSMFTEIKGFKYKAYEMNSKYWFLELGDIIKVDDYHNEPLIVFNVSTNHTGAGMSVHQANSESVEASKYKQTPFSPQRKTEIEVDKLKQEIKSTISTLETVEELTNENTTSITQTNNAIGQEVIDRQMMGDNLESEISAQTQLLSDQFQLIFTNLQNGIDLTNDQVNLFQTYFRWDMNGAIIGRTGDPVEFFQQNNMIGFRENGEIIAKWERGTMTVSNIIASVSIMIGYHLIEKYDSANPIVGQTTTVKFAG